MQAPVSEYLHLSLSSSMSFQYALSCVPDLYKVLFYCVEFMLISPCMTLHV